MPQPLDAERPAAEVASPRLTPPRPTPFPRKSAEAIAAPAEEPDYAVPPDPDGVDVWALVRRAQEGDAEAFGEIYDCYVTMVHRYVYHRVGDRATEKTLACGVLQDRKLFHPVAATKA